MIRILTAVALSAALSTVALASTSKIVSKTEFGDSWPFTAYSVRIVCDGELFIERDSVRYSLFAIEAGRHDEIRAVDEARMETVAAAFAKDVSEIEPIFKDVGNIVAVGLGICVR